MSSVKHHQMVVFFGLAFVLPWSVWMTSVAQAHDWSSFHIPQALVFWLGLTIVTYLAAGLSGGKPAIRDLVAAVSG
ncbi:MAG: hypothetical protein ACR2OE_18000 [Thermomicrobiales bacterium]